MHNRVGTALLGLFLLTFAFFAAEKTEFFQSYLFGYLVWVQIAIGSLCILLIFNLTGGAWGELSYPPVRAASKTFWLFAILLIPVIAGLSRTHIWANPLEVAKSVHLQHKHLYLNVPFFLVRQAIYFSTWIYLGLRASRSYSAGAMVAMGITITFAGVDWSMSLQPEWYSTVYGMLLFAADCLSAFAFAIIVLMVLAQTKKLDSTWFKPQALNDLGNLLLAFTMVWAYLSYFQYLIIWCGNLPDEAIWYQPRINGGWQYVIGLIALFQFAAPFLLLLSKARKRDIFSLGKVALVTLLFRFIDTFWWILPAFRGAHFSVHWTDFAAVVGVGAIWFSAFSFHLEVGHAESRA
jgi:hypothetical protein